MKADFLILASSARFLVESARESHYSCVAVDGFGDADLSVIESQQAVLHAEGFETKALAACCDNLLDRYSLQGVVVGPGLDNRSGFLNCLSEQLKCFGNRPEVFSQCADRKRMYELFTRLEIPHPASTNTVPFLQKSVGGSGGMHIRWADSEAAEGEAYVPGTAVSHLFLADGKQSVSVGFNTQWQSTHDTHKPFCYGGAINRCLCNQSQVRQLKNDATQVTRKLGLRGLNSMDYIKTAHGLYCLEINPRPSATMQLYPGLELFDAHIQACGGNLPNIKPTTVPSYAHAVIYAPHDLWVQDLSDWPQEVCDIPLMDSGAVSFKAGHPVCSICLSGNTIVETLNNLYHKITSLVSHLNVLPEQIPISGAA